MELKIFSTDITVVDQVDYSMEETEEGIWVYHKMKDYWGKWVYDKAAEAFVYFYPNGQLYFTVGSCIVNDEKVFSAKALKELIDKVSKLENKEELIEQLKSQLDTYEATINELKDEKERLERQLQATKECVELLKSENENLIAEKRDAIQMYEDQVRKNSEILEQVSKTKKELEKMREKMGKFTVLIKAAASLVEDEAESGVEN